MAAQSSSAVAYTFTTLAGKAIAGSTDGTGSNARFNFPVGIAVDSIGNLYVADAHNSTIRHITPAGVVSTLAGLAGSSGTNDGTGSAARFDRPYGIAVDSAANVYVADHNTIRKITTAGVVSTLAGLAGSYDIAVDSTGNLYVSDDAAIRKITAAGVVSTLAGLAGSSGTNDGTGSAARFHLPLGIAVDSAANVYVAEGYNNTIRKITAAGVVTTIAGLAGSSGTNDGTGSAAQFEYPHGIAVDSTDNLYVADSDNNTIRKITPVGTNWVVSTFAGSARSRGSDDETGSNARFNYPTGIAVDSAGNLYVTDLANNTIRKLTPAGVVSTLAGLAVSPGSVNGTGNDARFDNPTGITVDSTGSLYLVDEGNNTIRKITSAGVVSTLAGLAGSPGSADGTGSNARFNRAYGIAVDSAGNLYLADSGNNTIRKITAAGVVSTFAGSAGVSGSNDGTGSVARFESPAGVALDSAGNLYVADGGNRTIRKLTSAGVVSTLAGTVGDGGSADGTGTNAQFKGLSGIAVDSAGNLFAADAGSHTIRKVTAAGVVSTLAGLAGKHGSLDGTGSDARFFYPYGIAVDSTGNLYVAERYGATIRKITPAGTNWAVSTIAGKAETTPLHGGSADGTGSDAQFTGPQGIAVDSTGNLYVADTLNNTIRKGVFTKYTSVSAVPYMLPTMNGQLTVVLQPPEAEGQWRFPWESSWHTNGYTATDLVAGNYPIEFRNVPGYLTLPIQPVQVTSGNTTAVTNEYLPTLSAGDANSAPGSLTVFLGPTPPAGARWGFLGEDTPAFTSGFTTNLLPGTYLIDFTPVSGRVKPSSQAVQINPGQPSSLSVNYLLATTPPGGVYLPFVVPTNQVNDETTYPFGFNGQLHSDNGYGSGVAVQTNVVLTAAHLVFNDQMLSYVSHAHWFFRRDAGVSEPLPQAARGFYVLSGYAAQRTNDLGSGYSPEQSTPPSRNMDVAALYFLLPVAGGGHGGYLPSDAVPNTWLTSTALKMLVGYPVDGSQFGDANIVPGKMYQTDPQSYTLSVANDPVPDSQQVYVAPWFLSYPGNSGGPLYVQLNGYHYPAAVYLGTLFSGSQPYASVVRAINSNVVNLITLAASQGDSGTNNTGGGVITIIPSQAFNTNVPGYIQFHLAPPAAVGAGAAWRLQGGTYSTVPNFTVAVSSTNLVAVEFKALPGWNTPNNQPIIVQSGQFTPYAASYTVTNPVMVANGPALGITGTTGTVYRIESRSSLTSGTWLPVSTNTIQTNGFNLILSNPGTEEPNKFYRAFWLRE